MNERLAAILELAQEYGILLKDQLAGYLSGSVDDPETTKQVLRLAEKAFPHGLDFVVT